MRVAALQDRQHRPCGQRPSWLERRGLGFGRGLCEAHRDLSLRVLFDTSLAVSLNDRPEFRPFRALL